jgi:arylsulfatase A-like enzyme
VSGRANAALLLLAVAALAVDCRPVQRGCDSAVLIVVDTLRPDHLGDYGHDLPTSPQLDRWMASARVYERAFATSSWTLPSFASILTGQLPARHGAGERTRRDGKRSFTRLDAGLTTLAEIFRDHGYATGAVVGNAALAPVFGLDRGFDTYDYVPATTRQIRRADVTVRRALAWIDQREGRPFFLVIHLFDPHMSYDAPPPQRGRFSARYSSKLALPVTDMAKIRAEARSLGEGDRRFIAAAYDEEIAFVDQQLGVLFDGLERRGVLERGIVSLTADHGEEFFEHGGFEHGHAMWQEILRLPLALWGPGVDPGRESAPVSLVDLAPTLLEANGIAPPEALEGVSLWPNASRGAPIPARTLYAEGNLYGAEQQVAIRWPHKFVWKPGTREGQLWNLERDPGEVADTAATDPGLAAELNEALHAHLGAARERRGDTTAPELDATTRESLHSLGYVE